MTTPSMDRTIDRNMDRRNDPAAPGWLRVSLAVEVGERSLSVRFDAPDRGITALVGPSGSGKTTCLRGIAGLECGARGIVTVGGAVWQDSASGIFLPSHRRSVGMVFQDARLFPHCSVRQNLEFGIASREDGTRSTAWAEVVEILGLGALLSRMPGHLSGWEAQRVAIGRALLTNPRLLLLDEPLSALDEERKDELLPYLERLRDEHRLPMIYVSHSMPEVARLADRVLSLQGGELAYMGCRRGPEAARESRPWPPNPLNALNAISAQNENANSTPDSPLAWEYSSASTWL